MVKAMPRKQDPERYFLGYFTGEGLADGEQLRFGLSTGNSALDWVGPRRRQAVAGVPAGRSGPARPVHHPLARRRHLLHDRHRPELVQPQPRLPDQRLASTSRSSSPTTSSTGRRSATSRSRPTTPATRSRPRPTGTTRSAPTSCSGRRRCGTTRSTAPGPATSRCGTRPRATSARSRRPRCGRTRRRSRASTPR